MAWMFLWVLCVFVMSAVRGAVFDNFNECRTSFFKGTSVKGLDITSTTPKPPSIDELYLELNREVYVDLYRKVYNQVYNPVNKNIDQNVQSVLEDFKSAIDQLLPNLEVIKSKSENVKSLLTLKFNNLQQVFNNVETELAKVEKSQKSLKEKNNLLELIKNDKTCHSAYLAANPAYICQQKDNNNYFATLYDRTRRIPLYSAYKMDLTGETERTGVIKFYEPQLIHRQLDKKQMTIIETTSDCGKYSKKNKCDQQYPGYQCTYKLRWSQATDGDFTTFDRGHLNPAGHHNKDNSEATMTFTNVAPQNKKMNNDVWSVYEKTLRAAYVKGATAANNVKCDNLYVVTGVIPGNTWQFGRVNVPSYYWSAHCCTKVNTNEELPVLSGGALCPNTENGKIEEFKNVKDLEQRLKLELKLSNQINIFAECVPKEARRNSFP